MSREDALKRAEDFFESGELLELLSRRVRYPTESQEPKRAADCLAYLSDEMTPYLEKLGFDCRLLENPVMPELPFLAALREEDPALPTILVYGHGDTVRGMEGRWRQGLEPWRLVVEDGRWYGRGTSDNKGQHTIDLAALGLVSAQRGRLGFNVKVLIEVGEEMGSPGLREACRAHRELLAADGLIASDGPRLAPDRPTIFGGSRGVRNFDFTVELRDGGHHSGNWGGLLADPGIILAHALASIVDRKGRILVPELRPPEIPESVRRALEGLEVGQGGPAIDPQWGEPGLTPAEQVYAFNSFDILAFECGDPAAPAHAVPPRAWARGHLRFVAGCDPSRFLPGLRRHLEQHGFQEVQVRQVDDGSFTATRLDPDHPWARWASESIRRTCGEPPVFLPNLGGSLPNDAFTDILGMPTIWVPHTHAACSQHAPDEHLLAAIAREGLLIMTGLFWDLGENPPEGKQA